MQRVTFFEIGAADGSKEAAFFADLFGWRWTPLGESGGGWTELDGARLGLHGGDPAPAMVPYFQVTDIEAAAARVMALGGTAALPGADEPAFGRFVNCVSAQGVRFGLHQLGRGGSI